MKMLIVLGIVTALGTGCVSTKQFVPFPDQATTAPALGKARIYVLRDTGAFFGAAVQATVRDGNVEIGRLGVNGYLCWEREPGETVIWTMLSAAVPAIIRVSCEADTTHFVRLRLQKWSGRIILLQAEQDEGQRILAEKRGPEN